MYALTKFHPMNFNGKYSLLSQDKTWSKAEIENLSWLQSGQ